MVPVMDKGNYMVCEKNHEQWCFPFCLRQYIYFVSKPTHGIWKTTKPPTICGRDHCPCLWSWSWLDIVWQGLSSLVPSDLHYYLHGSFGPLEAVVFPLVCEAVDVIFFSKLLVAKARPRQLYEPWWGPQLLEPFVKGKWVENVFRNPCPFCPWLVPLDMALASWPWPHSPSKPYMVY